MDGLHFVVTSHPALANLKEAICESVNKGVVRITATEVSLNGDELEVQRAKRTRNIDRTFLLKPRQIFFEPVLTFVGENQTTHEWVTVCPALGGDKILLRIGGRFQEEA